MNFGGETVDLMDVEFAGKLAGNTEEPLAHGREHALDESDHLSDGSEFSTLCSERQLGQAGVGGHFPALRLVGFHALDLA